MVADGLSRIKINYIEDDSNQNWPDYIPNVILNNNINELPISDYAKQMINKEIRNITAITGFLDVITNTLDRIAPNANKSINKPFIFLYIIFF